MSRKITVAVEEILICQKWRRRINKTSLDNIIWTRCGKEIKISKKAIEAWEFKGREGLSDFVENAGLSNIDFITSGKYKEKK